MDEFDVLLGLARRVRRGGNDEWCVLSLSERLAVALILNRAEWLAEERYTIPEAMARIGPKWRQAVPEVAQALKDEGAA